jgi:hypothetical protein
MRAKGDRLTLEMRWSSATFNKIVADTGDIAITITKDGSAWFKGILTPQLSHEMDARPKSFAIEATDMGQLLRHRINEYFTWAGYSVCNPADTAHSIVHQLAYMAGFSAGDLAGIATISKTIDYFSNDDLDNKYWDFLDELQFQFGYVFYFTAAGVLALFDVYPATATASFTFSTGVSGNCLGPLSTRKAERQYKDVEVDWYEHQVLADQIVFSETQGATEVYKCLIPIAAGGYYPTSSNVESMFADFAIDGYEVLAVTDAVIDELSDYDVVNLSGTAETKRFPVKFYNGGAVTEYIKRLDIRGNAIVKSTIHRTRQTVSNDLLLKLDAGYLTTEADATRLSSGLKRHYQYAPFTYRLESRTAVALGTIVLQTEAAFLGQSNKCVVVEVTERPWDAIYEYVLEGIEAYSANAVTTQGEPVGTRNANLAAGSGSYVDPQAATVVLPEASLLIPLYIYPTGGGIEANWAQIILQAREHQGIQCYVVANPSSGPGTSTDGNYTDAIKKMQGAGVKVLGYVASTFAAKSLQNVKDEIASWVSLYPGVDGLFVDEVKYEASLSDATKAYYQAIYSYARQARLYPVVGNPGCAVPEAYFTNALFDICVVHEGDAWPTKAALSLYAYNTDYDRKRRAVLVYDEAWSTASFKMCLKYVGSAYCNNTTGPWDSISTNLAEQFQFIGNRSVQLSFEADDATDDDRLPDGDALLDCQTPELSWHGSFGTLMPKLLPGKRTVFEPPYIGSVLNPRCLWPGRGAVGVWKATTNLLAALYPSDWSTATGGKTCINGATAVLEYVASLGRTATRVTFSGAASGAVHRSISLSASTAYSGSMWVYCETGFAVSIEMSDFIDQGLNTSWTLAPGLNYISTSGTTDAHTARYFTLLSNVAGVCWILDGQLENSPYATPFTPSTRAAGSLDFAYPFDDDIAFSVRPGFTFDCAEVGNKRIFFNAIGPTGGLMIYYDQSTDRIVANLYKTAGVYFKKITPAFTTNAALQVKHSILCKPNTTAGSVALYLNGVECAEGMAGGDCSGVNISGNIYFGYDYGGAGSEADSAMGDFVLDPSRTLTTAHYLTGRPYYDPHEVMTAARNIRLSAQGSRNYNSPSVWTDSYGREASVDAAEGFQVKDATGKILFQTPNAALVEGSYPMGQYFGEKYANAVYQLVSVTSFTLNTWYTQGIINNGYTNVRGVKLKYRMHGQGGPSITPCAFICFRPTGTTWDINYDDMTPMDGIYLGGPSTSIIERVGMIDVPVSGDQFDYNVYLLAPTSSSVILQIEQIGIYA